VNSDTHTLDGFLGGRIQAAQPKKGFRAGHDSVLLAASVPIRGGEHALELGAGAGIASLCLAARVADCRITGIEIDAELAALANTNAARNAMDSVYFLARDVEAFAREGKIFDHVFFNPPFHQPSGTPSRDASTDRAKRDTDDSLVRWTELALAQLGPKGSVTLIVRADRVEEVLSLAGGAAATLLPLAPRAGEAPKRALLQLRKGNGAPPRRLEPFVLHRADGKSTEAADAVLRGRTALVLAEKGFA
jgi:tRNA1(Val) A37 N6-methylase TrmN6